VAPLLAALMVALLCWLGFGIWTAWRAEQQRPPASIQKPEA
jgi:threonine/homoserine/homoserine lactone efflux protein